MTNSKSIGNSYEREFAYKLSEWITGDPNADICWRDTSSGSRHSSRKKQGKETVYKADIVCTDLQYQYWFKRFYIDTKSYKSLNSFFINKKNIKSNGIFLQWVKTVTECPKEMIPIMPCKIRDSKTPEFIILPLYVLVILDFDNYMSYCLRYNDIYYTFGIILQEDFFKLDYKKFYEDLEKI